MRVRVRAVSPAPDDRELSTAADAQAVFVGLPAPVYVCVGCERRPRFDGRCGCS